MLKSTSCPEGISKITNESQDVSSVHPVTTCSSSSSSYEDAHERLLPPRDITPPPRTVTVPLRLTAEKDWGEEISGLTIELYRCARSKKLLTSTFIEPLQQRLSDLEKAPLTDEIKTQFGCCYGLIELIKDYQKVSEYSQALAYLNEHVSAYQCALKWLELCKEIPAIQGLHGNIKWVLDTLKFSNCTKAPSETPERFRGLVIDTQLSKYNGRLVVLTAQLRTFKLELAPILNGIYLEAKEQLKKTLNIIEISNNKARRVSPRDSDLNSVYYTTQPAEVLEVTEERFNRRRSNSC